MPRISAMLTEEARRGWRLFAEANDVSFTATIEAAGRILASGSPTLEQDVVVKLARQIDRERRER